MNVNTKIIFSLVLFFPLIFYGQASIRVASTYEDSVRVVVLWNHVEGLCEGKYVPLVFPLAGVDTRDFVLKAIDTTRIVQVKVFQSASFITGLRYPVGKELSVATLEQVQQAFGKGKYPHVIVHINAGHTPFNGSGMQPILSWAVDNGIGVVEIGDDGATLAQTIFGIKEIDNYPAPMEDAIWLDKPGDSLKICIHPERDWIAKAKEFPYLNGLVSNAYSLNSNDPNLYFKPFENGGRCQADADYYKIPAGSGNSVTFLGYEQGYNATIDSTDKIPDKIIGYEDELNVIVLLQDTIYKKRTKLIRRGVILSLQPQFLKNEVVAQQLIYDAIIFSSLMHKSYLIANNKKATRLDNISKKETSLN